MAFEPLLPALARQLNVWFPELEGRALAVSEVEPFDNKTNVPTLPVAVVAMISGTNTNAGAGAGGNAQVTLADDLLVQFVYEPVKYKREDGADTPFYAFYDYESTRDRLITGLKGWRTPRGGSVSYVSLEVESDEFAVYMAFRLRTSERWCQPVEPPNPCDPTANPVVDIKLRWDTPPPCCERDCPPPEDPCDAAQERTP